MNKVYFGIIGFIVAILLISPLSGWAQTEEEREDRLQEAIEEERGPVVSSTEELIELLKQRALRKQEEARREQLWATKGTIGLHVAYDNNVNTDTDRRGVEYVEQYFSYSWVPTFSNYFGADIGPWYFADIYCDNDDTTMFDGAFKVILKYYPRGEPRLELQPGIERQWIHYPEAENSSYIEDKAFLKFKHRFGKGLTQDGKYEYAFKEYDKKRARSGPGSTSYIPGMVLEKSKHTLEYNIGFPWKKNNLKVKQKAYKEVSNDHYRDYYDVYSYKIAGECSRSIIKKLSGKVTVSYERKNYSHRTVASPTSYAVAEYDDIYTQKLDLYYALKKGWTLSYTFTHKRSDSNYSVYDYDKASHKTGVYISF